MLFTCLPEGARIPGRFPRTVHARGKWFTIDIHCHVTSLKAAAIRLATCFWMSSTADRSPSKASLHK